MGPKSELRRSLYALGSPWGKNNPNRRFRTVLNSFACHRISAGSKGACNSSRSFSVSESGFGGADPPRTTAAAWPLAPFALLVALTLFRLAMTKPPLEGSVAAERGQEKRK